MFGWFKRAECRCQCQASVAAPVVDAVPLTSPAHALAISLTSPETRWEWKQEWVKDLGGGYSRYRNETRDITLTKQIGFGKVYVTTPFTLNDAEKAIVLDAIAAFQAHRQAVSELEALSRLTAQGIEARRAATTGAVHESPVAESDAPDA